jgi:hypothetical protein
MAVFMLLEWDGVTKEQYETVRHTVNWEGNPPKGGKFHVAAFTPKGLRVTDVWESREDFQDFVEKRLMPGTKEAKIAGEPHVEVLPAHAVFAPAYRPL